METVKLLTMTGSFLGFFPKAVTFEQTTDMEWDDAVEYIKDFTENECYAYYANSLDENECFEGVHYKNLVVCAIKVSDGINEPEWQYYDVRSRVGDGRNIDFSEYLEAE